MRYPTAFPWTPDGEGLCKVLQDPGLWSSVFKDEPEFCADFMERMGPRKARISLVPDSLRARVHGPAPDRQQFGALLMRVLADPRKRRRMIGFMKHVLKRKGAWRTFFGFRLMEYLARAYPSVVRQGPAPKLGGKAEDGPERAEFEVLEEGALPEDYVPFALFACASALLGPQSGVRRLQYFYDQYPALRGLLSDGEPPSEELWDPDLPAGDDAKHELTGPPDELSSIGPAPPRIEVPSPEPGAASLSPEIADLLGLLEEGSDWAHELTLERQRAAVDLVRQRAADEQGRHEAAETMYHRLQGNPADLGMPPTDSSTARALARLATLDQQIKALLRERIPLGVQVRDRLERRLERNEQRLLQLDEALRRLREQLAAAELPWLEAPLVAAHYPAFPADCTLGQAQDLLDAARADVSRILQADSALRRLLERLREPQPRLVPRGVTALADVADRLERAVARYQRRFEERAAREQSATDFFERFAAVAGRESLRRFLQDMAPDRWANVARFLAGPTPCTDAGKCYERLAGEFHLVSLLVAYLWQSDPGEAAAVLAGALADPGPAPRVRRRDLLAFLTFAQLQELAVARPETAPDVAELIFVTGLRAPETAALEYLEPLLDLPTLPPACVSLYRACLDAWRADSPISADRLLAPPSAQPSVRRSEQSRQRLLQLIQQRPTMTHNYYRLRLLARTHFLEPLLEAIRADDPERAWRQWQEVGDLDAKVEECVRLSGRRRELDRSHYQQTHRYLEGFENELRQWYALRRPEPPAGNAALSQAVAALRGEAAAGRHPACVRAWETVRLLGDGLEDPGLPPSDFGQRLAAEGDSGLVLLNAQDLVNPLMTWSWPLARKQGSVPLGLVLADRLRHAVRQATGARPTTLADAVEEYWQQGDFWAAWEATADDPLLHPQVLARLETKKADLRAARAALLEEADGYKEYDPDIAFWCQEISRALDAFEFEAVDELFQELEGAVVQVRRRRDPVRLDLLQFLFEAGLRPDEGAAREDLQRQVEDLKAHNRDRRLHLLELEKVRDDAILPQALRERWSSLARALDRPARWPAEEAAFDAAWAVQQYTEFLTGAWQDRDSESEQAALLADRFAEWVPQQFEIDPTFAGEAGAAALRQVKGLAEDIRARCFPSSILRGLGLSTPAPVATPTPAPAAAAPVLPPPAVAAASVVSPSGESRPRERQADPTTVFRGFRSFLNKRMGQEAPAADADPTRLRSAIRGYRWAEVRQLAAALARQAPAPEAAPPSDVEAVYALALAYSIGTVDRAELLAIHQNACLGVLAVERSQLHYYLPPTVFKESELVARATVVATDTVGPDQAYGSALRDQLHQALARLIDAAPTDPASEWLRELFWMASQLGDEASARLAGQLWDALRGKEGVDEPRSFLLRLLFRLRRREALHHLAGHTEQFDDLIKVCLSAFEQAEEDSSIRPQAREILITLREQAFGKSNTKPWINLFQYLEAARSEEGEPSVTCTLQSDHLAREAESGPAMVQVLLTPSLADPPRSLALQFVTNSSASGQASMLLLNEEEMLLRPRTFEVGIPAGALAITGDVIDISYRLVGETVLRRPIDVPGRWTFPNSYHSLTRLPDDAIARAWPGASGDPVVSSDRPGHGFHGREEDQLRIERYLSAPGRGRSLMIFGQRRIGKTSLLLEMVRNSPPRQGAVCGAFFDFNGLDTPSGPGEMQRAFFQFVVSKLCTEPVNEPLRRALTQAAGREVSREVLGRGLSPQVALEDALEGLVQRLEQLSGGLVSRVAFYFDEFDLFVEPLLTGRREEVLKLHGSLRQIIQRSQRIMLVLAGSGLQRLFTEDYLHPFYGSIDELEVKPFDWATERGRQAVERTFLPPHLRPQLCPGERFAEVAQRAAGLTGGHPYYLSMLGFAAARAWRGHPLTPALLNRVADLMIQNKIDDGSFINRRKFYQPIFQSLKRLSDREQAVARLMLVSIARLTSTDRQRWKKWRLIEAQFIEDAAVRRLTSEDDRLTAMKYLEKERVVEFDQARSEVRLRIPMTAAAIREDAREIHDEALRQLRVPAGGRAND